MAFEPIPRLAKKPELSAGQACGILKYHRLALLDSYVFKLIKSETVSKVALVAQVAPQKDAANAAPNGQLQHLTSRSHSRQRWVAPRDPPRDPRDPTSFSKRQTEAFLLFRLAYRIRSLLGKVLQCLIEFVSVLAPNDKQTTEDTEIHKASHLGK